MFFFTLKEVNFTLFEVYLRPFDLRLLGCAGQLQRSCWGRHRWYKKPGRSPPHQSGGNTSFLRELQRTGFFGYFCHPLLPVCESLFLSVPKPILIGPYSKKNAGMGIEIYEYKTVSCIWYMYDCTRKPIGQLRWQQRLDVLSNPAKYLGESPQAKSSRPINQSAFLCPISHKTKVECEPKVLTFFHKQSSQVDIITEK